MSDEKDQKEVRDILNATYWNIPQEITIDPSVAVPNRENTLNLCGTNLTARLGEDGVPLIETKYMLFSGDEFYPSGGWKDFKGYFDCIDDAIAFVEKQE